MLCLFQRFFSFTNNDRKSSKKSLDLRTSKHSRDDKVAPKTIAPKTKNESFFVSPTSASEKHPIPPNHHLKGHTQNSKIASNRFSHRNKAKPEQPP